MKTLDLAFPFQNGRPHSKAISNLCACLFMADSVAKVVLQKVSKILRAAGVKVSLESRAIDRQEATAHRIRKTTAIEIGGGVFGDLHRLTVVDYMAASRDWRAWMGHHRGARHLPAVRLGSRL
jgi:hypothetical protein